MFDQMGQIIIAKEECDMDADDLMMAALDAGAEDVVEDDDSFEVLTTPENFSEVREALEKQGIPMAEAEITMIPQNYVDLTDPEAVKKFTRIIDMLDDDDDVQAVYHMRKKPMRLPMLILRKNNRYQAFLHCFLHIRLVFVPLGICFVEGRLCTPFNAFIYKKQIMEKIRTGKF